MWKAPLFPTTLRSWGSLGRRGAAGRAGRTGAQTGQRARSPSCLEAAPAPSPQEPSRCSKGGFIAVEMLALSSSPNLNFFLKSEAFPPPCPACTCATALPTTLRLAAIRGHLFPRPLWRATPAVTSARWPGTFRPPPSPSCSRFPQPEGGRPGSRGLRAPAAAVPVGGRQAPEAPQPASRPSRGAAWARWAPSVGKGLSRARLCSRPACGTLGARPVLPSLVRLRASGTLRDFVQHGSRALESTRPFNRARGPPPGTKLTEGDVIVVPAPSLCLSLPPAVC